MKNEQDRISLVCHYIHIYTYIYIYISTRVVLPTDCLSKFPVSIIVVFLRVQREIAFLTRIK